MSGEKKLKVAILDLYEGTANEGMRCIRQILEEYGTQHQLDINYDEFEVRLQKNVPALEYDIYISSGGPGSPLEDHTNGWESIYFGWLRSVEEFNNTAKEQERKYVLFICHSFQLACRYFQVGNVAKRKSTSFGVFPVHLMDDGRNEPVFTGLPDPFYALDSRDYQVIEPDYDKIRDMGATVLAIEKERPHVPLERAVMALRFNNYMLGTQFHPEADPNGMTTYLLRTDKKENVIENHGFVKWQSMIEHLNDPDKIKWTYAHVIPNFLDHALGR